MKINKVILIGFNRSRILINNYKNIRSFYKKEIDLYIDGPRKNNSFDFNEILKIKEFFNNVDDENLKQNYSSVNRGCKNGVIHAINSGFKKSDFCIIIEDDCYVSENFFKLSSYFYGIDNISNQIMCSNCIFNNNKNLEYYYNPDFQAWGWACSKNLWNKFKELSNKELMEFWLNEYNGNYFIKWNNFSRSIAAHRIDTWDYIFKTFLYKSKIKVLSFNKLLVENKGHDFGTHITKSNNVELYNKNLNLKDLSLIKKNNDNLKMHNKICYFSVKNIINAILSHVLYFFGFYRVNWKLYKLGS